MNPGLITICPRRHEFHQLLLRYWNGSSGEIAPDDFKFRLGQVHEQFDGFYQHDGQEFLALLLDQLHLDLIEAQKLIDASNTNGQSQVLSAGGQTTQGGTSGEPLSRAVSSDGLYPGDLA